MEGLVQADKCIGIVYNDPIKVAQEMTDLLSGEGELRGCDLHVSFGYPQCKSRRRFRREPGRQDAWH